MRQLISLNLPLIAVVSLACAHHARKPPATGPSTPATLPTPQQLAPLTIDIGDFRNHNGQLMLCVFDRKAGFPGDTEKAVLWQIRPIKQRDGNVIRFHVSLPPGSYAVSVIHDENANGKIDMGFLGIPAEGFGTSNNPKPKLRAPTFDESKFELPPTGKLIQVSIQYF